MKNIEYKKFVLTEKGADAFRRFGTPAQAGDPYTRSVLPHVLKQYIRAGFIVETNQGGPPREREQ